MNSNNFKVFIIPLLSLLDIINIINNELNLEHIIFGELIDVNINTNIDNIMIIDYEFTYKLYD